MNKKILKSIIVVALLVVNIFILTGCNNKKESEVEKRDLEQPKIEVPEEIENVITENEETENKELINEYMNSLSSIEIPSCFRQTIKETIEYDWGSRNTLITLEQNNNATCVDYISYSLTDSEKFNEINNKVYYSADGRECYKYMSYNNKWEKTDEAERTTNYRQELNGIRNMDEDSIAKDAYYKEDNNKVIIGGKIYSGFFDSYVGSDFFGKFLYDQIYFLPSSEDGFINIEFIFDKNTKELLNFNVVSSDKYIFEMSLEKLNSLDIKKPM